MPLADETSLRYAGWKVAFASSVGVFVSFASLLVYTFGVFVGKAFDLTGSYEALLVRLSVVTLAVAARMLLLPRYDFHTRAATGAPG